jgi:lysyl-tRNA synthetase class 2
LKRLLVGGFEKIYEFSRCFRNEGISPQHNPEFTQIEGYWAYATIDDLLKHIEGMIEAAVKAVTGSLTVETGDVTLDFTAPLKRISFHDVIERESGIDLDQLPNEESLRARLKEKGMHVDDIIGIGELIDHLWKTEVRPKMIQPTFVTDYPASMKPLAKVRDDNPKYSEGAQLLVNGMEIMNAFNEQNDPLAQEEVFAEQERLREQGSQEAQMVDDDYVKALKHGMPPAAGYGIGIDRLAMLLTNSPNIKEVILFPTLKPTNKEDKTE